MEELKAIRSDFNTVTAEMEAFKSTLRPAATQHSTPPAPQEAPKEEDKQLLQRVIVKGDTESTAEKQEPLYQATVEDIVESTAEKETEQQHGSSDHGSTKPDSKSTLSTILCQWTTLFTGDPAACLSIALLSAYQHVSILALNTLPGCIEHSEGVEVTGRR